MTRQAWKRVRQKKSNVQKASILPNLNNFLTAIIALASAAIAYAQYRVSVQQTDISEALASLELEKSKPDFDVIASERKISLKQSSHKIDDLPPSEIKITLANGSPKMWDASGNLTILFSSQGASESCPLQIRGAYAQLGRGKIKFIAQSDIQSLIKAANQVQMEISSIHTEIFVVYQNYKNEIQTISVSIEGDELSADDYADEPVAFSGAFSGGRGFYLDGPFDVSYCPALRDKISSIILKSNGKAGEDFTHASSVVRKSLGIP